MTYRAPLDDIRLALEAAAGLSGLIADGTLAGVDADTADAVLEGAAKFAEEELAPIDAGGDKAGAKLVDGEVVTPPGWDSAYKAFVDGGWSSLSGTEEFGGQHLPHVLASSAIEIWCGASLAFGLCPLLTQGAVDAIRMAATPELKTKYLPKMVAGEWAGTMNLTEPQAGTDLGALKTKAVLQPDGSYRIFGTKIFITYGDHELTPNIIHLVLARLPNAPAGTKGISLFLVPKYLVNDDGTLGARNDVKATRLEEKLGIHASPTCVMNFGEKDGALGYLVGETGRGLNHMFVMMNRARLDVGMQGVAVAERATQRAIAYAKDRKQGRTAKTPAGAMAPIIEHPDVRRNLMTMRALTAASRSICLATARELDISERAADPAARAIAASRCALLTPVAKAFSTDAGVDVASIGVQVHGGMGFIEETGAAQHYRDARILPIYEGTNGIQAIDLVTRKLPLEGGKVVATYIAELDATAAELSASNVDGFARIGKQLAEANAALRQATQWLLAHLASNPDAALAGATPYLRLFGIAAGGAYLGRGALFAARGNAPGEAGARQVALAKFFAETFAPEASGLAREVMEGAASIPAADDAVFNV
jgi:acyl-CoA dehydrogenase